MYVLEQHTRDKVKKKRESLFPIIEIILLCGHQDLALRSYRDRGVLNYYNGNIQNTGSSQILYKKMNI